MGLAGAIRTRTDIGDGAGILIEIPHSFFARECSKLGFNLPEPGRYGVGMMFLPVEPQQRLTCEGMVEQIAAERGTEGAGLARHAGAMGT